MSDQTRGVPVLHMADVAGRLGVSKRWLSEFLRDHPCGRRAGRKRIFTEADFAQLVDMLPRDEDLRPTFTATVIRRRRPVVFAKQGGISPELEAILAKAKGSVRSKSKRGPSRPNKRTRAE